jgi:putative SOS response-associated peptidase YedK
MCYHFQDHDTEDYIEWFVKEHNIKSYMWKGAKYYVNGYDHGKNYVITQEKPDEIQQYQWGLIAPWVKDWEDAKVRWNQTLNAKSETVFELPSFRGSIRTKKCLVFAKGFFEWRHINTKQKIPYIVGVRDQKDAKKFKPFTFGGIYNIWTDKDTGEVHETFSIITVPANDMMKVIHNSKERMPLIIPEVNQWEWLTTKDEKRINELMIPYPAAGMIAHPVSKLVSQKNVLKDVPEISATAEYAEVTTNEFL